MARPATTDKTTSRALLHTVARLHYESDLSQVEIARRLGLSTATVSRLIRRAREEGIVRIEIRDYATAEETSGQIKLALGLKRVAIVNAPDVTVLSALAGPVGAMLRDEQVGQGSVLAVGWGRAVRETIRAGLPKFPGLITVPATGGMQQAAAHFQINEFVRLAAEQTGGMPHFIHAPYLPSPESRDAFMSDPTIRDQVALWDRINVALVGVGLPHAVDPIHAGAATSSERALANAAGDVIRHYFDADGQIIPWEGDDRLIAVSVEQMRAIPLTIGVAASAAKATAIIGAVRARLINALVTDTATAEAILVRLEAESIGAAKV
ncbi:winged helix-turn-helix transcriptional regulator [Acidisoma cellulosilytica]|uniref:Winged helix-turn-helix transcriptional regulator n=1 Tax=Acidisoma cellulosilyticum TaxID=2802395 RepID=A0A964E5S4_9PROT|nr:sugar-binding domain-containing protein [Acidisoma cellulosilyticum]MCB8882273.1 winged helix-turn-helix transcriptional regulator [Acidisoma cellulosilyticum]